MEERGRFELPVPVKGLLISSQVQSATLPPLHEADTPNSPSGSRGPLPRSKSDYGDAAGAGVGAVSI